MYNIEDIHSIVLSSRTIQHWIFLIQKLHSSNQNQKLKRQSSSSLNFHLNQFKKSRSYFNLNNSPTDEQILLMSQQSQLSTEAIKHCFRNTLFKERQRNKDSPYNFSNPPSTSNQFDLDEYQQTGTMIKKSDSHLSENSENDFTSNDEQDLLSDDDFNQLNNQQQSSRRANRSRFSDNNFVSSSRSIMHEKKQGNFMKIINQIQRTPPDKGQNLPPS